MPVLAQGSNIFFSPLQLSDLNFVPKYHKMKKMKINECNSIFLNDDDDDDDADSIERVGRTRCKLADGKETPDF